MCKVERIPPCEIELFCFTYLTIKFVYFSHWTFKWFKSFIV